MRQTRGALVTGVQTCALPISCLPVLPGQWLGMLGGGQLGRMFCHAAQSLGYKVAVLDPAEQCPAGVAADRHIRARYDDESGLEQLSDLCRAVTTEFENVPAGSLERLARQCPVTPSAAAVGGKSGGLGTRGSVRVR